MYNDIVDTNFRQKEKLNYRMRLNSSALEIGKLDK